MDNLRYLPERKTYLDQNGYQLIDRFLAKESIEKME
jgi:hypothetical protein